MKKYSLIPSLIILLVASACTKVEMNEGDDVTTKQTFAVHFSAERPQGAVTKTTLDGTTLSWEENDKIGVFVSDDIQSNMAFRHTGGGDFYGEFVSRGTSYDDAVFYSYYPHSWKNTFDGTAITSVLPEIQAAPFDPSADFIVADAIEADYDEEQMPALSFQFNNHLFAIAKVTVTNSDPSLKDEKLCGIELQSKGSVLAGSFSTELGDGADAVAVFGNETQDRVSVDFAEGERPELGLNVPHTVYAVVAAGSLSSLKLTIKTDSYRASVTSSEEVTLVKGCVTALPAVDFASLERGGRVRTMSYWGDSICSSELCSYLQKLLGPDWIVYRGGVAGDEALAIAGRQGGIPMCIGATDSFTLPADHTQKVKFNGLYSTLDSKGNSNPGTYKVSHAWWFKYGYEPRINPCVISFTDGGGNLVEVECEISFDEATSQHYIQRTADGDAITVPSLATVTSYGATAYRNADVVACFMGVNAHPEDDLLSQWYDKMMDYVATDKFIVVGYNRVKFNSTTYWTESYRDLFAGKYGEQFLDLLSYGNANADRLLIESGTYNSLDQKTDADKDLLEQGEWPAAWFLDYENNVHPGTYGYRAYAIMVYEKMRELGYLD